MDTTLQKPRKGFPRSLIVFLPIYAALSITPIVKLSTLHPSPFAIIVWIFASLAILLAPMYIKVINSIYYTLVIALLVAYIFFTQGAEGFALIGISLIFGPSIALQKYGGGFMLPQVMAIAVSYISITALLLYSFIVYKKNIDRSTIFLIIAASIMIFLLAGCEGANYM